MRLTKIKTTSFYKKIVIGFSGLTIILLGLISYYSLSKTAITITLNPRPVSTSFSVTVKKDLVKEKELGQTVMAGYLLSSAVEDTKTFANSNQAGEQVESPATGTVTIYNNWSQVQPLAATTRLLTPAGILFRLKNRVDVPAGGKLENVEVYADIPGATGNIAPAKFSLPGLWPGLQEKIYAESFDPMTGGLRDAKVVTQSQINDAKKTLTDELISKAMEILGQTDEIATSGDTILKQAITTVTLAEKSSVQPDQEADSFDFTLKSNIIAVVFDKKKLADLALAQLKEELASDEQISTNGQAELTFSVQNYNMDEQTATLEVKYSALVIPRLSSPIFNREKITGRDTQEIKTYFSNFDEIKSVTVKFSPFWVSKAPELKDHIEIKIE